MSMITLQDIKATQDRLATMIAEFEASTRALLVLPEAQIEIGPGERYAGAILDDDGSIAHHVVLLLGERESINHGDAVSWAAEVGGALPTRREQSLLYANLKGAFAAAWYWSCETHETNGEFAWFQNFLDGYQNDFHKSYEGRAVAVRRLIP